MTEIQSRRLRILVVEDNDDIRKILEDMLTSRGYYVCVATDGEGGLFYLQREEYDLMITDLGLPGMSGWDLSRASKRYQSRMPVLAISSWQGKESELKIKEYGIERVIWKPFRFSHIKDAIDDLGLGSSEKKPAKAR